MLRLDVLKDLVTDLRGLDVPKDLFNDLRAAFVGLRFMV